MDPEELRQWLLEHADLLSAFTDYEVALQSEADLHDILGTDWFREETWNQPGYRFVPIGQEGTGGEVALWIRPGNERPPPVVFFGSEGGTGVLAPSAEAWAMALAHGAFIVEYANVEAATSALSVDNDHLTDADPERLARAEDALARYRDLTIRRFGPLPPFEELVEIEEADARELRAWVDGVLATVLARDDAEARAAAAKKQGEARTKAAAYTRASVDQLPPDASHRADGSRHPGRCPACGREADLRLTRFEELVFGLCFDCYFSSAW